jgi:hypothetical protein
MPARSRRSWKVALPLLLDAVKRRGLKPAEPLDTYRLCSLAAPDEAEAELKGLGFDVRRIPGSQAPQFDVSDDLVRIIHHLRKRVFGRPGAERADRYSKGFNAYYAGQAQETAEAEIGHYLVKKFAVDNPKLDILTCDVIKVEFFGEFHDLGGLEAAFPELLYPNDKQLPQAAGRELNKSAVLQGLRVPSARHRIKGLAQANIVGLRVASLTPIKVSGAVHFEVIRTGKTLTARKR